MPIETAARAASSHHHHPFGVEMLQLKQQLVRVGRQRGHGQGVPLLLFNGIGGNIELLEPIARWMPEREVITFDIPGVGHSALPNRPYRMPGIARLAAAILDHYGHAQADVLGISWGGGAAQQFARTCGARCRRLIAGHSAPASSSFDNSSRLGAPSASDPSGRLPPGGANRCR
jgi:pimeloyl-ACP methyl ester carboxylesterase